MDDIAGEVVRNISVKSTNAAGTENIALHNCTILSTWILESVKIRGAPKFESLKN